MIVSYYEGLSCPVCHKPFVQDEDIVVCPQCGLPHHRACWKSIGRCFEESKHGTEQQWSRYTAQDASASSSATTNVCPNCQENNSQYAEFCSRCGAPLSFDDWHSAPAQPPSPEREYAPYRATNVNHHYSSSDRIGDVSAEELAAVVGNNAEYYITRFRRMERGGSGGWNWAAFLLSPYWLFYRKHYLLGGIYFFVFILTNIVYTIISVPLQLAETDAAMMAAMQDMQQSYLFYPWIALSAINFVLAIVLGIKGNQFYYTHCRAKIQTNKKKIPDLSINELSTYGGVSVGSAILFYAIAQMIVMLVTTILSSTSIF